MTKDQIIAMADKAALYDTGLDQWVVPSSEILMAFASLVAAQAAAEERENTFEMLELVAAFLQSCPSKTLAMERVATRIIAAIRERKSP